jgi:hypothetical protein
MTLRARARVAVLLASVLLLPALSTPALAEEGPKVTSTDYPSGDEFHGSPGQPGEFTFSSNGDEDVQSYFYDLNGESCVHELTPEELGGSVTVTLTPRRAGPNRIYARTVGASGDSSACVLVYSFLVASPSDPVAHFTFDEGQGDQAADTADSDRGATLSDGVEWVRGRVGAVENPNTDPAPRMEGTAVHLSGRTDGDPGPYDEITVDHPTVDTSGSFSVSAWVKLERPHGDHIAVAQEGTARSAFRLGYQGDTGKWAFEMASEDGHQHGSPERTVTASTDSAEIGAWTHLLGVHYDRTGELTLYVDGVKQDAAAHAGPWSAQGPLTIGRTLSQGTSDNHWSGAIDDVRVWNRVVPDEAVSDYETNSEVWRLANRPLAAEGLWKLDEWDGTTVDDATDHGLDATLHGDPLTVWNTAENDITFSPGMRLNGDDEYVEASGPALRTDRSFSVAAWVRLDEAGEGVDSTAVSQTGEFQSGFQLGYEGSNGSWVFKMAPHDDTPASGSGGWTYAYSSGAARPGEWTHLTGVYDHSSGELVLYVNTFEESRVAVDHAWHAEGPLRIGSAQHGGSNIHHWTGDIDDVHTYQGVLREGSISSVYNGLFPSAQR